MILCLTHAETSVFANALKHDDFTIVAINPGWNETDMGGPTARKLGMDRAPLQPSESILKMLTVIKGLSTKDTGNFLDLEHGDKIDD